MPTYDQQDPKVENQTNVAGNVTGGDVGDGDGGINRAIITGRDVIRSILVTGDHNRVFVGNYEPLEKIYKEPWQVFERTSRLPFTGREWLLDEVDAFLNRHDRGYFILEASAGLGKTAFLAWLAKERGYIHHFCELTPGAEGVGDGLKNLAAQLALAYELEPEGILLVDVASHPSYLSDLLKRAADKRNRNEKIIVVIDALDESDAVRHQNVMGLPSTLPEGIYFIVSQRPTTTTLKVDDPTTTARQYFRFSADDDDNQADMRRFLEYASELPEVVRALQESEQQYTSEQFITTLMQKCRGVWIYLYFVVQEIVQGMRSPLDLAALPDGMTQYYAHYWQRWRNTDEQEWDEVYLPLLTTLAASQEALSCQRLIEWSGSTITERNLRRLLEREWRPFLAIAKQGNQSRYRFYHATLQEFFEGQLAQENLSLDEIEFLEELSDETQKRHNYLVERYLQAWGGMESNLQGLKDAQLRDLDDRYGLRHLAYHLEASGRIHDLHRLLRVEWRRSKTAGARLRKGSKNRQTNEQDQAGPDEGYQNAWFTVQEEIGQTDAYLADVTRAWRLAEESVFDRSGTESTEITGAAEEEWWNECVSLQCRYALIQASLNTHANNIRPGLFVELIKQKIWLPEQGLCYARQVTAPNQRVEMLVALVPFLPNEEHPKILQEALGVA
ncbi:MAG: hypothetical protein KDE47_17615, partial [Caldilineaceae bacterium]|nr:hypothetical protein [Caldilineaceae bacterium]